MELLRQNLTNIDVFRTDKIHGNLDAISKISDLQLKSETKLLQVFQWLLNLMTATGWYYDSIARPLVDSVAADATSFKQFGTHAIGEIEFLAVNSTAIGI